MTQSLCFYVWLQALKLLLYMYVCMYVRKKGKGSPYSITERRVRSWSRFLAVSLQVTWVINPAVGRHYFRPGSQLPSQPLEGCYQFRCLVNRGTMGVNSLPKTVTRQRCGCDLNPGPIAPESSVHANHSAAEPWIKNSKTEIFLF